MLLPILGLIAALGFLGVFFSLTREIFEGQVLYQTTDDYGHAHKSPVSGVTVRLYERSGVEKWLSNDLVASLVQWKDPKKERDSLNELVSIYEGLLTVYPANTQPAQKHKDRIGQLSEYLNRIENPVSAVSVQFPKELFIDLRRSIPPSLFHPVLSLFSSIKDTLTAPKQQTFFDYLKFTFPEISPYVLSQIEQEFQSTAWDNLLDYQPRFDAKQASFFIEQFTKVDKIALTLLQYAVNDEGIVHLAPKPLQIQSTDADGRVQFKIPRYSKLFKFNERNDFVVIAISSNQSVHPGQAFAWLKSIRIDPDALLPEEKLPFWPAVQNFFLTNQSATAQFQVQVDQQRHATDSSGPLPPLKFNPNPKNETLFAAISLLSKSSQHHLHAHIHPHDSHRDLHSHSHSHVGQPPHHSSENHSPVPNSNFELFKTKRTPTPQSHPPIQSFDLLNEDSPAHKKSSAVPVAKPPPLPERSKEVSFDLLDEISEPTSLQPAKRTAPPATAIPAAPPETHSPLPTSSAKPPRTQHEDIYGTWVNTEDDTSYNFTTKEAFTYTVEGFDVIAGYFLLNTSAQPATLELIDQTDSTVIPAIIEFLSDKSFKIELASKGKPPPSTFSPAALIYHRIR